MRIIAGEWGGRRLRTVKGGGVRPTSDRVREAWMSAAGPTLEGARVVDLFAGSGALGLEALSRGAREVVFVEGSEKVARTLRANIAHLGARPSSRIIRRHAIPYAEGLRPGAFDVAFADPPYGRGLAERLIQLFLRCPFARELWVEHRSTELIPDGPALRRRRYGNTTITTVSATL